MQVTQRARSERGFSMFIVIMAMFVTSMFVAAGFAAANNGLSLSVENQERKSSYAAAEAGLGYYLKRLREDTDVWTQCDTQDANLGSGTPINQQWDGKPVAGKPGGDPRVWRKIPDVQAEYTVELLHTSNYQTCDKTKQDSIVDLSTGTFRIRITGRATEDHSAKRSINVTFRRAGFLKFVYFTDQENRDPQAATSATDRSNQQDNCVNKDRTARENQGCVEIQFASGDAINGPLHTNDENVLVCGTPKFGRDKTKDGKAAGNDVVEVSGVAPGRKPNTGCSDNSSVNTPTGKFTPSAKTMSLPQSNTALQSVAESGGKVYAGKTIIRLKTNVMDVTNYAANGNATTTTGVAWPGNGVLYVKNNGACNGEIPTDANYAEPFACGNVYVSGTYAKPLTIAAANDVIIRPTEGATLLSRTNDSDIKLADGSNATLGLIANNFVRVGHKVVRSAGCDKPGANYNSVLEPTVVNVQIDAAIMSLQHSFMVDNYDCGKAGALTVNGAIVQNYRGAVGTGSGGTIATGFMKDYWYDDRLRYRSPPYFLNPLETEWEVVNSQEQVPAR